MTKGALRIDLANNPIKMSTYTNYLGYNPFNSQWHMANTDVIAVMIWEKSSSLRQKNAVARVLRFSKKDFFFRTQIET